MDALAKYKNGERISSSELSGLTEEGLLELKELIDEDLLHIGNQLLQAKQEVVTNGVYSDTDWFRRATFAKKVKGQLSQKIQNEMRKRRKDRGEGSKNFSEQDAFIRALLRVMDDLLLPAEKKEILAKAKIMQQKIMAGEPY